MKVVNNVQELKTIIRQVKKEGKTIGLVPTMGYLHEGHLSLMRKAKVEQDFVVASVFVNPIQFGPNEDYAVYPRDIARDTALAESVGVDVVFNPAVEEMYPDGSGNLLTYITVEKVTEKLCGASRPGHFRGVATVVTKLFNLVEADAAYFGQKDAQQVVVIKRMVKDLNMNVMIKPQPIVREKDGLALSSRNVYLSPAERQAALVLYKSLQKAKSMFAAGERDAQKIVSEVTAFINKEPLADIDYVSLTDPDTLEDLVEISSGALLALAVRIGKIRLIDNLLWEAAACL